MEKEFVPYELAVLLKAIGFDEPCFGYYDGNYNLQFMYNGKPEKFTEKRMGVEESVWVGWISAPTFSQAFRWFREKNGFPIPYIQRLTKMGEVFYVSQIIDLMNPINTSTYEEAELACLTKLIEILNLKPN